MREERWPGEPLIERLTIDERDEVQACYRRQWSGARRRRLFEEQRKADAKAAQEAKAERRKQFTVPRVPCSNWQPYQGARKPHPEGQRPYQRWDGKAPGVANFTARNEIPR